MIKVGDHVIPKIVGLMERGDPPYIVTEISEDKIYTIFSISIEYLHIYIKKLYVVKGCQKKIRKRFDKKKLTNWNFEIDFFFGALLELINDK